MKEYESEAPFQSILKSGTERCCVHMRKEKNQADRFKTGPEIEWKKQTEAENGTVKYPEIKMCMYRLVSIQTQK